jgi:hypothetical protein
LTFEERKQLDDHYSELGKMPNGVQKPKVCWASVKNGTCGAVTCPRSGQVVDGKSHPGEDLLKSGGKVDLFREEEAFTSWIT